MEKNIVSMLEQILSRLEIIESDINSLKQGQSKADEKLSNISIKADEQLSDISMKIDLINTHLIELDAKNADRHLVLNQKLDNLSKDITVVEAVAGKNMVDIANIKLVK